MIKIIKNGNPEKQFISDVVLSVTCHNCGCEFQFEVFDSTTVSGMTQIKCPYCKNLQKFFKDDIKLEKLKRTKKVKECSVQELENYYSKKTGFIPDYIAIYWYDVRFMRLSEDRNNDKIEFHLNKNEEIEVDKL